MDWDDLKVLLAAARQGSASRAAQALGVTVTTVTRRLTHLEEACGSALFARVPEGVRLTEAGAALLPHAEAVERAVLAGHAAIGAIGSSPQGTVSVTLPLEVLQLVVLPQMAPFCEQYPDVHIQWRTGTEVLDVPRREVDIAVRAIRPHTDDADAMLVRRVRTVPLGAYGTQAYLDAVGDPGAVASHRWLGMRHDRNSANPWIEAHGGAIVMRFETPMPRRVATACGLGAAVLPAIFAEVTPGLVPIPLEVELPAPIHVYMVTHRAIRHAPAVAATWEFLASAVAGTSEEADTATLEGYQRRYIR